MCEVTVKAVEQSPFFAVVFVKKRPEPPCIALFHKVVGNLGLSAAKRPLKVSIHFQSQQRSNQQGKHKTLPFLDCVKEVTWNALHVKFPTSFIIIFYHQQQTDNLANQAKYGINRTGVKEAEKKLYVTFFVVA